MIYTLEIVGENILLIICECLAAVKTTAIGSSESVANDFLQRVEEPEEKKTIKLEMKIKSEDSSDLHR